jgi:hypothetical protein
MNHLPRARSWFAQRQGKVGVDFGASTLESVGIHLRATKTLVLPSSNTAEEEVEHDH